MNSEKRYIKIPEEPEKTDIGIDFDQLITELERLKSEWLELDLDNEALLADIKVKLEDKGYSEEDRKKVFEELLLDVKNEAFREFGHTGNLKAFEGASHLIEDALVQDSGLSAAYTHDGKILVEKRHGDPYEILQALADYGRSKHTTDLHHEYIHSFQVRPQEQRMKKIREFLDRLAPYAIAYSIIAYPKAAPFIAGAFGARYLYEETKHKRDIILDETQAFRGSDRFTHDFLTTIQHLEVLRDHYKVLVNSEDIDMAIIADQEVRRLYALGVTDEEIGQLIQQATWDRKHLSFTTLEQRIQKIMKEKGMEEEDVDNLVMAEELKNKINFQKMKFIASRIIKKFYEEISAG